MSDFKVVRNITIVNTRMITPITREFGAQYSILASGSELAQIGVKTNEDGSGWINSNATYANGDSIAAIPMIDRNKRPVTTELGAGSEVELAFKIVTTPKGTYYNLAAVKVMKMVKPFSVFGLFDEAVDENAAVLDSF
jgi:hypothetical protein